MEDKQLQLCVRRSISMKRLQQGPDAEWYKNTATAIRHMLFVRYFSILSSSMNLFVAWNMGRVIWDVCWCGSRGYFADGGCCLAVYVTGWLHEKGIASFIYMHCWVEENTMNGEEWNWLSHYIIMYIARNKEHRLTSVIESHWKLILCVASGGTQDYRFGWHPISSPV